MKETPKESPVPLVLAGEQVLWMGQSQRWWLIPVLAKEVIALALLLAILLMAIRFVGTYFDTFGGNFFAFFLIFGLLAQLAVRGWYALRQLESNVSTTYIITNYRFIMNRTGLFESRTIYDLKDITEIAAEVGTNGVGSLSLQPPTASVGAEASAPLTIPGIPNVREVHQILIAAKKKVSIRETPVLTETPVWRKPF